MTSQRPSPTTKVLRAASWKSRNGKVRLARVLAVSAAALQIDKNGFSQKYSINCVLCFRVNLWGGPQLHPAPHLTALTRIVGRKDWWDDWGGAAFLLLFDSKGHSLWLKSVTWLSTTFARTLISQPRHSSACRHSAHRGGGTPRYQGSDLTSCSFCPPTLCYSCKAVRNLTIVKSFFLLPPQLLSFATQLFGSIYWKLWMKSIWKTQDCYYKMLNNDK